MQRENGRDYSDALKKHKLHLILQETEGLNSFQIIKTTIGREITPTIMWYSSLRALRLVIMPLLNVEQPPTSRYPIKAELNWHSTQEEEEERHWQEAANIKILPTIWETHPTRERLDGHIPDWFSHPPIISIWFYCNEKPAHSLQRTALKLEDGVSLKLLYKYLVPKSLQLNLTNHLCPCQLT